MNEDAREFYYYFEILWCLYLNNYFNFSVCAWVQFPGDSDLDNEPPIDFSNDLDDENELETKSDQNNGESAEEDECKSKRKTPKRKQWQTKKKNKEYQKIFSENMHLFDMSCDCCSNVFESLDEARKHYTSEHDNPRGYIKCCGRRMFYRCQVVQHVTRHLDPDKFKYVKFDFIELMCYRHFPSADAWNVIDYFGATLNWNGTRNSIKRKKEQKRFHVIYAKRFSQKRLTFECTEDATKMIHRAINCTTNLLLRISICRVINAKPNSLHSKMLDDITKMSTMKTMVGSNAAAKNSKNSRMFVTTSTPI